MKKIYIFSLVILVLSIFNVSSVNAKNNMNMKNYANIAAAQVQEVDVVGEEKSENDGSNANDDGYYTSTDNFKNNCKDIAKTLRIVGYLILIIKILVPIIIIVKASIDFFSVVTSGKADSMAKVGKKLGFSLVAAILIFLMPTMVDVAFGIISSSSKVGTKSLDSQVCMDCLFDPFNNNCKKWADKPLKCVYSPKLEECSQYLNNE